MITRNKIVEPKRVYDTPLKCSFCSKSFMHHGDIVLESYLAKCQDCLITADALQVFSSSSKKDAIEKCRALNMTQICTYGVSPYDFWVIYEEGQWFVMKELIKSRV